MPQSIWLPVPGLTYTVSRTLLYAKAVVDCEILAVVLFATPREKEEISTLLWLSPLLELLQAFVEEKKIIKNKERGFLSQLNLYSLNR